MESLNKRARKAFGIGKGWFLNTFGSLRDEDVTLEIAGLQTGDCLTLQVVKRPEPRFRSNTGQWVNHWGDGFRGSDSSHVQDQLRSMQRIQANGEAFAAILGDGPSLRGARKALVETVVLSNCARPAGECGAHPNHKFGFQRHFRQWFCRHMGLPSGIPCQPPAQVQGREIVQADEEFQKEAKKAANFRCQAFHSGIDTCSHILHVRLHTAQGRSCRSHHTTLFRRILGPRTLNFSTFELSHLLWSNRSWRRRHSLAVAKPGNGASSGFSCRRAGNAKAVRNLCELLMGQSVPYKTNSRRCNTSKAILQLFLLLWPMGLSSRGALQTVVGTALLCEIK